MLLFHSICVCLSVCPSVRPSVRPSVCRLYVVISFYLSVRPSVYMLLFHSIYLSVCLSVCLCLSVCPSVRPSVRPSVCRLYVVISFYLSVRPSVYMLLFHTICLSVWLTLSCLTVDRSRHIIILIIHIYGSLCKLNWFVSYRRLERQSDRR